MNGRFSRSLLLPVGVVLTAATMKYLLQPAIQHESPFVLFYGAVVISAWYGGMWAGILAGVLSASLAGSMFMDPVAGDRGQMLRLLIFLTETAGISVLAGGLHAARAQSRHASANSAASEESFALLVDRVADYAIFMLDPDGRVMTWNTGAARMKGYTAEEIVGQHFSRFYPAEDVAADKPRRALETAVRTGKYEEEGIRVRKDGTTFWAHVVIAALRDDDGALRGFAKVTRDVTERHETLERERAARAEAEAAARAAATALRAAEQSGRAKDEFLTTLSHELRTPMTAVLGWATLLQDATLDDETRQLATTSIIQSSNAQARLIDDILDASRAMVGKLSLDVRDVDLAAVADEVVTNMRGSASAKGLTLRLNMRSAPVKLRGDAVRLQQILWNLISNAVKFTPSGGEVVVTVYATEADGVVTVRDSGSGISEEFLPFVFGRFTQADGSTTRQSGGLGLGLAIAQELAELHGGRIEASSSGTGLGATFTLSLPLHRQIEDVAGRVSIPATYPDLHGTVVLVVEDDPNSRAFLTALIRECGATPVAVRSVEEALRTFESRPPHVVLADIAMPEQDGFDLIRRLRERDRNVPAIAVTAIYTAADDRVRLLEAGFDEYRRKPVAPRDLAWTIAKVKGEA